jgi:UDP-N-acetylmuramoyl-tripeptide--D-alanyl-D-alanine ligase
MDIFLINFSLILILVYFYRITRHGLHILQLENYYTDRYIVWMKRYIKKVINIKTIILLIIPIVFMILNLDKIAFCLEILFLLYLIVSFKKQKEKKAFVVTARIRRVYTTYLVLFVILFVCFCIYSKYN